MSGKADNKVIEIDLLEDFNYYLLNNDYVIVDFYADWCGPCKKLKPVYAKLAIKFREVTFLTINIDNAEDISERCSIYNLPTIMFYNKATNVDEIIGFDPDMLIKKINKLVS